MKKVCMVVPNPAVKGGIAAVVNGYRGSKLESDYAVTYVESYIDGNKLSKLLKGISAYFHFAKTLFSDRPDIIHIHSSFGPSFYRKIPFIYMASLKRIPILNHIHGADFDTFFVNASVRKRNLIKKVYEKCTVLIALSEEWKAKLSQIVTENKIVIIKNYSVLNELAIEERQARECNYTILFLGELGRRKGCYDIPAIVSRVLKRVPNCKFVLGGTGTPEDETAIKKLCVDEGVASHVVFPGWVRGDEKDRLLREADVFLLPSYNEGMPMSILDAMGYGLPVISTNVGGIPKILHDGENGVCCNPGDIDSFAKGITELLNDNYKRANASKASLDIIAQGYSFDFHLRLVEHLYDELLRNDR